MIGQFHEVNPISRDLAEKAFESNDTKKICDALIRVTYYDDDYNWVQKKCVGYLKSNDIDVKRLAIICLGHLARIHNKLDKKQIIPLLKALKSDKELGGIAEDALDDIEMFLH